MKVVELYLVVSDPRTGDGGGRWLAATPHAEDAEDIAAMLGGLAEGRADAIERDDGRLQFIGTGGCPIYLRAWHYAEAQMRPEVARFVERMLSRAIKASSSSG